MTNLRTRKRTTLTGEFPEGVVIENRRSTNADDDEHENWLPEWPTPLDKVIDGVSS